MTQIRTAHDLIDYLNVRGGITGLRMGAKYQISDDWQIKIIGFDRAWNSLHFEFLPIENPYAEAPRRDTPRPRADWYADCPVK